MPNAKKFRFNGIPPELEEKLDLMFSRIVATGENVWIPSSGVLPPELNDNHAISSEEEEYTQDEQTHLPHVPKNEPTSNYDTQRSQQSATLLHKRKKVRTPKSGSRELFLNHVDDLVDAAKSISSVISTSNKNRTTFTILEVLEGISKIPDIFDNFELYGFALEYFKDKDNREIFMGIPMERRLWNLFSCAEILRFANGCHLCYVSVCLKEMPLATDAETCVILKPSLEHIACTLILPLVIQYCAVQLHRELVKEHEEPETNCIGAIDGTHVNARIPVEEQVAYIGLHHSPTQNVMAACDFNMFFTFVSPGWEGSAHDARIFKHAMMDPKYNFPAPPPGKFYLVDAGYPLQKGYLKPYIGTRYHLPDFRRGSRTIMGHKELFNSRHSSLRSVIERSFGVWKKKWGILRDMPNYSFKKQRLIVVGTMGLHNYIRRHISRNDPDFIDCDVDENFIHPEAYQCRVGEQIEESNVLYAEVAFGDDEGVNEMIELREKIAFELCN
ncbi:hypothetical protein KFK09_014161 [Dendrobium nobile]|uniref:DDE Tnp4 domain-containing protein n=1 Tax=Dendrobium nobile TaxID=94219 RepID=A0A8T3B9C9_DENNO|nr:hypothetical protein KFK09_014161 [Dendrobium nobile]